eukprot:1084312-Ditylum_brightwellii.AAC.1
MYMAQIYNVEDVFHVLKFDDNGIPINQGLVSLLQHYKILKLEPVKQHCKYLNTLGSPYVVQSLQWSHTSLINSCEEELQNHLKNKLRVVPPMHQGGLTVLKLMMDAIFSMMDQALRALVDWITNMKVTEYTGENIAIITGFICSIHTILYNCDFVPSDIMQLLYNVSATTSDTDFVQYVHTIKTNEELGLLPNMNVETFFDNIESFYKAQVKTNKWAKVADEQQGSVFIGQQQQHYKMRDFIIVGRKGEHPEAIHLLIVHSLCNNSLVEH